MIFYLPDLNIAIEYDEKHHNSKKHKDLNRQKEIENEIKNIEFIRVNEGEENLGINLILKKRNETNLFRSKEALDSVFSLLILYSKISLSGAIARARPRKRSVKSKSIFLSVRNM